MDVLTANGANSAKVTELFTAKTASEIEDMNIKLAQMSVQKTLLAEAATEALDRDTQVAMSALIDATTSVDQALIFLQLSTQEAAASAESAVEIANSAHMLVLTSKKSVDDFNYELSKAEIDINLVSLREMAALAARASLETYNEIKETLADTSKVLSQTEVTKNKAFIAKEAANAAAIAAKKASVAASLEVIKSTANARAKAFADSERLALDIANNAKSSFLANMSHEIRTPLASIVGFSEVIANDAKKHGVNPDISEAVDAILRNSKHLLSLINNILDISKIDAGSLEIERTSISVRDELSKIIHMLSGKVVELGNSIKLTFEPEVPELIFTDSTKLRQILINIISNSIKFTKNGEIKINVDCIGENVPGSSKMLRFQVIDNGIGISYANQAKLFSSYGQANRSTTRRFGGTGLGLMLSKKLAQFLKGDVFLVHSAIGQGCVFEFKIPLIVPKDSEIQLEKKSKIAKNKVVSIKGCRILLAEDSPDLQNLVGRIIKSREGVIEIAGNGCEAIQKMKDNEFDIILMDIEMPLLDGNETNKQLRKMGCKIPIIAFTAHALVKKEYFDNAIYDDYLSKPTAANELIATIARWYHPQKYESTSPATV